MSEIKKDVQNEEVKHDVDVINRKAGDVKEHEAQIEKDRTKMMKDLHEKEIEHDQKVIEKKEKDLEAKGEELASDDVVGVVEEEVTIEE